MRRLLPLLLLLCINGSLSAQKVRGPFSFADKLMSDSYIGHSGKTHIKVDPPKPTSFVLSGESPSRHISGDKEFIEYLLGSGMVTDALVLLGETPYFRSDTLYYLAGLALFDDRQFQGATEFFSHSGGAFRDPSLFLGAFSDIHTGNLSRASESLASYAGEHSELASLQMAGIGLIEGDFEKYRKAAASFTYADHRFSESETALDQLYASISSRHRSPVAAACLSAVLPGAGKVYAGRTGEGVAAFLTVLPLGVILAEQWKHYGPAHWSTIISGAVFSLFYIGNIYGSYVSVGVQEQVIADETKAVVMYNLHIPIRSIFR